MPPAPSGATTSYEPSELPASRPMDCAGDAYSSSNFLLQSCQQPLSLFLEFPVLRRPIRIERSIQNLLELDARVGLAPVIEKELGEEEMRGRAVLVVLQGL